MTTTVIQIVAASLRASGHTGLLAPHADCGCEIDDLQPCGSDFAECRAGYKHTDPRDPSKWGVFLQPEPPPLEAFDSL